jgi:hypothetical protein
MHFPPARGSTQMKIARLLLLAQPTPAETSMVLRPIGISLRGRDLAAWIVQARGLGGIATGVEDIGQAGTGRANGADRLGGAPGAGRCTRSRE